MDWCHVSQHSAEQWLRGTLLRTLNVVLCTPRPGHGAGFGRKGTGPLSAAATLAHLSLCCTGNSSNNVAATSFRAASACPQPPAPAPAYPPPVLQAPAPAPPSSSSNPGAIAGAIPSLCHAAARCLTSAPVSSFLPACLPSPEAAQARVCGWCELVTARLSPALRGQSALPAGGVVGGLAALALAAAAAACFLRRRSRHRGAKLLPHVSCRSGLPVGR